MSDAPVNEDKVTPQFTPEMLAVYGTMLTWLFVATVMMVVLLIVPTALIYHYKWEPYTMAYVVMAGAIGGFVSSLSRLYRLNELPALLTTPHFKIIRNRYVAMYALIPPLVGLIAAAVIYLAIAGGLIQGDLFPFFKCGKGEGLCDTGINGLFEFTPRTVKDSAKALVWGFASGFSERLFPGIISDMEKNK